MLRSIARILFTFLAATLIMVVCQWCFCQGPLNLTSSETWQAIWHGLSMNLCMAGYVTALPALLVIIMACFNPAHHRTYYKAIGTCEIIVKIYFVLIAFIISLGEMANYTLYPYWGFPLDTTPLFYFMSSPSSAMASLTWWQGILAGGVICVLTWIFYMMLRDAFILAANYVSNKPKNRAITIPVTIVITAALFIPIRGGFTVSTMNVSRAYFSHDMRLNHGAVNPLFSFMYSATHQTDFRKQFRFMEDDEAEICYNTLYNNIESSYWVPLDSVAPDYQPDIQLIILESFSSHLLPSQGGEPVAMRLDSLGREGWLFENIYASSFRTDRALPAILNGFPGQPTTSLMKWVSKLDSLPAIGNSLKNVGYSTAYFYGGDINFTNMNALLVAGGFKHIIKDTDFPMSERLSKWGAHDDKLFQKALEYAKSPSDQPRFTVIQTSSSHEPFEVPYQSALADERANAFAFTDSCLGAYIDSLKSLPSWDKTIVAIVPDHYGAYPRSLEKPLERHHVPLVFAGGALKDIRMIDDRIFDLIGSQTDIAATLVFLGGGDAKPFRYSNNLLDPCRRPYAFFSEPSWAALLTDQGLTEISVENHEVLQETSNPQALPWLQAYLQTLYNDIDAR
ncbi:MAG: LTA synthase family protein [Bacteroidales bacterium]|nr:LTA synthase family protein [Bacteroidales bacterium]